MNPDPGRPRRRRALGGCAKEQTRYGDARGVETVTNQFGSTDLQLMAESMARSMLQAPVIASSNLPSSPCRK